ncbi:phosphotransferase [Alisedimentitalea sp. MJ-SS2]|uniref:aminoglycoside phosphotransferase family protein n=1 Tax=Aliisedimentitalea sp. MJ-SS2 TaxID=3049795 RepID=UPI0029099572|nr:phosphotransferase [Alisedimentitalea sp. MJ-SS2]MDU8927948.1 phosphotransferase [Alisedimentitalea sp. MJ-SS2]
MRSRDDLATAFLSNNGWGDATRAPLAGDASNRRYERLSHPEHGPAILMDAPPETGEDVRPFVHIAGHLTGLGLSAPLVIAQDAKHGFLLLEDLGDALFARVIPDNPALETPLYETAIDALWTLHQADLPADLTAYSPQVMTDMAALAFDWYLGHGAAPNPTARTAFTSAFLPLLTDHAGDQSALIQRDYHAENLLWLPDRSGPARVGLLDFQDAMTGHPAYDLVSLLQDARRDVPPTIEHAMITRYLRLSGWNRDTFETAYHLLGAQRNLRILGVFARLCLRDGKAHYVDLIPRVWGLYQRDLAHPSMAPVAQILRAALPEPTPELLNRLKDKCGQIPTP